MSDKVPVQIVGLPEFKGQLSRLKAASAADCLAKAVTAALLLVQNAAKEKAPKLTRTLSRSIHIEVLESRPSFAEAAVGTDVAYAAIQEFGGVISFKVRRILFWVIGKRRTAYSVTIPPHPYLRPAWDENKDAMIREIRETLELLLKAAL